TRHRRCYGTIAAMTRQGNDPRRWPRRIRVICNLMFVVAAVTPFVVWRFDSFADAGQIAQLLSVPLAAFATVGFAGTMKRFERLHETQQSAPPAPAPHVRGPFPPQYPMAPYPPSKGSGAG